MHTLSLTTPSLLFSAISLILLAFTNRFLSYAALVRNLKEQAEKHPELSFHNQISNLYKRLQLVKIMQTLGVASFLSCVLCMLLIFLTFNVIATYMFIMALLFMALSLLVCLWEINISVKALEFNLDNLENRRDKANKKK